MSFWGAKVNPDKPYTHMYSLRRGRLRLTQATLGGEIGNAKMGKKNVVQLQCIVKNKEPVLLCALVPGQSEACQLELEFEEKYVTFSVLGHRSVHLAGYYIGGLYDYEEDTGDSDTGSDSMEGLDSDSSWATYDNDDDDEVIIPVSHGQMSTDDGSDYDPETDEEMMYNQPRGKSSGA